MPDRLDRLDRLAAEVRRRPARAGACRVVAIDGPSGSGKTELADRLADRLAVRLEVPVVHMDDLYPGWDGLADAVPALVGWLLAPLAEGRPAGYRRYDWERGEYAEWHDVPPTPDLLVEGVGSGARACAPYLSLLVWVEAPRDVRFTRGIARDGEAYRPHWERWARQEEAMFAAEGTRGRADVIIDGTGVTNGPEA